MNKLKMFLMAFLLGFAVNGFAQADGLYYLYEVSNKQFLTHGEDWGTRACLDFYGSPVTWNSTEGSLKFKDNNQCLFKTGDNFFYTDNNSTGFKFVETEGGYYLQTADGASYAKLVDGAHLKCLMPTDNVAEAVVWQLKTKAERDAMVTDYVNQNYVNVINAAGLDITANDFLTELAKYTAVDMTSAIGTARFAGNVGDWTYVKGRDQGGQPAYGTDFCEIWQGTGRHTKTINGLTPGIYKVTVQGFERASGWAKCNELAAEGLEISTTTFTANGQHVAFKSWFSGKSDEKNPNNTGEAVAKFNEGKYQNEVYAYVGEDGILNLMVDKHAHVGDNWVLFNNFTLTYYEAPAAPAVPVWKDIKIDFTNDKVMTSDETNIVSFGIKMNDDATTTRVAADDPTANIVITGKYHSTQHGLANFSATVKVEGPVKIGMGSCAWGGNVTVKDENGVEVANAFNTNNGACWATADGAEKNVIYTYYKGEAATLTIAGGSYTPYFSVEKIALEDIPTVMKVNYSLGETGATGILPANFEIDGGKTFNTPVNRTLYVEGKTLTGWTDGTNNYTIGQEITAVADTEITLVPVFTDNTVTLADRKEAVTIVWDFQQKNGAPVVAVQGKTMIWVAQAVVNGQTIDVKMDIDATSGKVANGNWQDWCQINPNTKLTIPAAKDAVIGLESYAATTTTTIAGEVINQETKTPSYTYTGEEATVDIVIGDGSYWRTVSVNLPVVAVEEPKPTEPVVELTHTASSYCETDANAYVSTVDAEKEHVNNSKFSGTWQGAAYADFSIILPEGHSIKSASLAWAGIGSSKDRTTDIMYVNAGEQLDYTALAAGNAKVNLPATYIATVTFKKSATTSFTTDVTEAVKAIIESGQNNVIFKFTNNVGAGDLVGKGAAEKAPVLTVETVSADDMTKYTVVAMLDADTLKVASYDVLIGETATASAADMAAFKNEDGSKKYIYVGGNTEITTVKDSASNIITLVFREAEKWTYTVNAVDAEGNVISELMASSDFEGETVTVPYNQYILKDSVLYSAEANNKEYNLTISLGSNEFVKAITYSATSINNVVFFSEAEDVWGMTKTTSGNANIRCSNSAGAFNGDDSEVSLTTLTPGVYTIAAQVWGNAGTDLKVACGNDTLVVSTAGYILSGNKSFTVRKETEVTIPALTGNENRCFDWIYIQKTGVVPPTEVANISALKDVEEGVEVKLALTDAIVNIWSGAGQSSASYVEDATGAIKFDMSLSNMEWMNDSIKMNGYVYAQYGKDYDGIPQLSVSDSTGASKVETVAAVPASKVMTVAAASADSALSRYVKFENVEFIKKVVDDWGTTECYLVQGTDSIVFFDKFYIFGYNSMPDFKSFTEVQGVISVYDGKFEFYPYGDFKANYTPAVVVENIAAAKAVENGTNVNLTLKDAKITAYVASRLGGATAYIEDASGAIQIAGDVLSQFGVENDSTILNGNIYVKYVNEWGSIQLNAGDSIAYSNVEAKEGAVSPTTMAVKDVKAETNVARYVEVTFPSFKYDEENYCYIAVQNGDTIMVVDNFGWMSENFEMDENWNLVLPDSVSSIRGIVMWDDWNGYSISPLGIDEYVAPQDIVVNVTEGDIAAAVEAEKAKVAKVGNITINLTEGVAYTASSSIVAPAGLVINGNGAVITSSAELVVLPAEPTVAANEAKAGFYEITSPIVIENVHVKAAKAIVKSKAKYLVSAININNSIIEMTAQSAVVDFSGGQMGYPTVLSVNNSTVWSAQNTNKPFFTSQSGNSPKDINNAAEEKQTISIENSTFYNIAYNKNFNELRQKGQKFLVFTIKNNIIVNSGKANFLQGMDGGQSSANPTWTVENNTFGTLVDGAFTDVSASQSGCGEVVNSVVTNPGFKDVAAGDFTVYAGSEQAKQKIGDPRWLVEFDETLTGIDGINAAETLNGAVYTINGIKVREAGETLKGLSKGMYIINGKKYVVK